MSGFFVKFRGRPLYSISVGRWLYRSSKVMVRIKIAGLLAITLLLFPLSYGQGVSPKVTATTSVSDIRQVDFKNFTYVKPEYVKETGSIRLSDGRQVSADGTDSNLMRITYGDLTGDGSAEAIVLLREQNTNISRTLDEVFIYTLKSGKVIALAHFEGGRRGEYILSVASLGSNFKVENQLLILDHAILRESEDVPTQYCTIIYRWDGRQMVEVERSHLKQLPEEMREVG